MLEESWEEISRDTSSPHHHSSPPFFICLKLSIFIFSSSSSTMKFFIVVLLHITLPLLASHTVFRDPYMAHRATSVFHSFIIDQCRIMPPTIAPPSVGYRTFVTCSHSPLLLQPLWWLYVVVVVLSTAIALCTLLYLVGFLKGCCYFDLVLLRFLRV